VLRCYTDRAQRPPEQRSDTLNQRQLGGVREIGAPVERSPNAVAVGEWAAASPQE
jgi:hypothetical protein